MTMPLKELKQGQNYKIVYQVYGVQMKPRVAVMTYIGPNTDSLSDRHLLFSLRPLAGTQEMDPEWIIAIKPTDESVATEKMWKYGE
jgi:hypothetical protein